MKDKGIMEENHDTILNLNEHKGCSNFLTSRNTLIHDIYVPGGGKVQYDVNRHTIVFLRKGKIDLEWGGENAREVVEGQFFVLPSGAEVEVVAEDNVYAIACELVKEFQLCETFKLEKLHEMKNRIDKEHEVLPVNKALRHFLDGLEHCTSGGLLCHWYLKAKMNEFGYILRAYYPREKIASFLSPVLSKEILFKCLVLRNYKYVNSIEELARRLHYTRPGFTHKFINVMGETPSSWLANKRSQRIRHELLTTNKPLKIIAEENGFSSPPAFHRFCVKNLHATPNMIRKNAKY